MNKLLLIDGHSMLTRAFFGIPDLTNAEGLHTNAVYGFLNIMFRILDEEKPTHLMVAFDVKEKTFRHKMYEAYKGTRKPMPAELHEQVPLIKEVLTNMKIKVMEKAGYEADDIIGTVAKDAVKKGYEVVILSGDRDLLQLCEEHILVRIPKTKKGQTEIENYYAKDVENTYQVTPLEFIDLKALMGDTADNIPGVKSIGEKTAIKLITQYHSVENLYENIDGITPERVKNALINGKDDAFISKTLATININSPADSFVEDGEITDIFNEDAYKIIKRLEFKTILKKFDEGMSENVNSVNLENMIKEVKSKEDFDDVRKQIKETSGYVGIALNTISELNITTLTVSVDDNVYYIENSEFISTLEIMSMIKTAADEKHEKLALFNLKKYLHINDECFSEECLITDINICSYLLNPLKDEYSYDIVAREHLGIELESFAEIFGKSSKKKIIDLYSESRHKYIMSTVYEAYVAKESTGNILDKLKCEDMFELYVNIEYPIIYVLYEMEKNGILVDSCDLKEYSKILEDKINILEKSVYEEIGEEFNINSPKQLGEILFVKMQLPGGKKTKTGYSTSADVLEKLAEEHEFIKKILEYRQLTKLKSTYADGLRNYISYDDRIHGTFNQTITATGRISSTEPNLQNIPIRMEMGKRFRKVFIPKEGHTFIDADYSQIELRILAHMSDDENLINAYNSEQDIHKITAAKVFNLALDEVTSDIRNKAKAVNFGIIYGISSFGLSQDLNISKSDAKEFIKQYYETFPQVKKFLDGTVEFAKENGYVSTIFKRRRPIPELSSSNFMQRAFGERAAMNSAIQGTAADIMKIAMINVYKSLKKHELSSKMVLQVHDEILIEAKNDEVEIVKKIVREEMMNAAKLKVVLEIGLEEGNNWLEAH